MWWVCMVNKLCVCVWGGVEYYSALPVVLGEGTGYRTLRRLGSLLKSADRTGWLAALCVTGPNRRIGLYLYM